MADDGGVSHRRSLWWIAALVLTAASSGASFVAADRAAASSASAHERADAIRLVQLRSSLRRVHLEEVDLMALEVFGLATPTDVQTARATREGTRALAIAELRVMSHGSGSNAVEAGALASLLTDDEVVDGEVEPLVLFDAGRAAVRDGRPLDGETPTDVERLYDVMRLDSIGRQILNDGLDASYVTSTPPVPDIMVDYFAESAPYLGDSGGYLGPNAHDPLVDSYVWFPSTSEPHPIYERIDQLVRDSPLWEYDQWIVSWQSTTDPGPPPLTLAELVTTTRTLDTAVRELVDTTLAAARTDAVDDADRATDHERWAMIIGIALALGAFGAAVLAIVGVLHRIREKHRLASLDRLTGVGTRHLLEEQTAVRLSDPGYTSHLIAVIDLDRFKLVNDTWGHAIGDLVLVEVANRLRRVVDDICIGRPGTEGTIVRLGGDEFLLSLHSRRALDPDDLRRRLDDIRAASIEARDGERVQLGFSVGVTAVTGPGTLSAVMDAADLATYEDKARRVGTIGDRRDHLTPRQM